MSQEEVQGQEGSADDTSTSEESASSAPSQEDVIRNIKSEFSRKYEKIAEAQQMTNKQIEQLVASLTGPKGSEEEKSLSDLFLEDPDRALAVLEAKVEKKLTARMDTNNRTQQTIAQLQAQYPEFMDQSHPAYKDAIAKYNSLPASLKDTPEGAKMALLEAVAEHGLIPKTKRGGRPASDDFSVSGGSKKPAGKEPKPEVSDETLAFAREMGLDISNKKVVERLASRKRANWKNYQS